MAMIDSSQRMVTGVDAQLNALLVVTSDVQVYRKYDALNQEGFGIWCILIVQLHQ